MDPNNRLHLNFGNNDRLAAASDRTYPTTPSTFPQPVFPGGGQPGYSPQSQPGGSQQYGAAPAGASYNTPGNYFMQNQYQQQQQYGGQPPSADYLSAQASAGYQPRSNTPGNDPNIGLANQFSHQNLGGAARGNAYGARGASPAQRPRTAGSSGQHPQQGSYGYLHAPMPNSGARPAEFQPAPERNPEKYGTNANNNQKKCSQLAADFFKDSVKRARERNLR